MPALPKPSAPRIDPTHPLARGLVGLWAMQGKGGNPRDLVRGRTLTRNSTTQVTWTKLSGGYALDFAGGVGSYGEIVKFHDLVAGRDAWTISFLAQPDGASTGYLFDCYTLGPDNTYFGFNGATGAYWGVAGSTRTYTGLTIPSGRMVSVTLVKRGSGNTGDLYVDGVLASSYSGTIATTSASSSNAWIADNNSGSKKFDGKISQIGVWQRSLATAEVQRLAADPWEIARPARAFSFVSLASGVEIPAATPSDYAPASGATAAEWTDRVSLRWTPTGAPTLSASAAGYTFTASPGGALTVQTPAAAGGGAYDVTAVLPFLPSQAYTITATATTSDATVNTTSWSFTARGDSGAAPVPIEAPVVTSGAAAALVEAIVQGTGTWSTAALVEAIVQSAAGALDTVPVLVESYVLKEYDLLGLVASLNIGTLGEVSAPFSMTLTGTPETTAPFSMTITATVEHLAAAWAVDVAEVRELVAALALNVGTGVETSHPLALNVRATLAALLILASLRSEAYAAGEDEP